jgi:hypothetical protein
MVDDPIKKIRLDGADVLFMLGAEDDPDSVENIDAEVVLEDGSRWSATFLTIAEIGRIMERWRVTGECLGGSYFSCPDLVIVDRGGIDVMVEVLCSALVAGSLQSMLSRVDIEE